MRRAGIGVSGNGGEVKLSDLLDARAHAERKLDQRQSWTTWVQESLKGSASSAHRWSSATFKQAVELLKRLRGILDASIALVEAS